ncbi:MAG TPA: MXAN_5187 family protein [Kofleriaceae bacterium]|nr:MXAN_5187 family protein [Kofleriaceae bacterium]
MFWSKIWFFLIALVGAVAFTIALVLPRPAQRALVGGEITRLQTACSVIQILLADDAKNRVELAGAFARSPEILNALESASGAERLDEPRMKQVRDIGDTVMKAIQGGRKPDFAMLIDKRGRVVARVRLNDNDFGDIAAGRPLIDDALAGYLRDDLWAQNGTMYFVSAAPVVKQGAYVGAVVLGHQVTNQLAESLVKSLSVDMGFHLGADGVAGSRTIAFEHTGMQAAIAKLGDDMASDCQVIRPMNVHAGVDDYTAIVARLPGEAAARQAYYSVIIKRPDGLGFLGTLRAVKQNDLSFGNFPWILVGGGFLVVLGIGIGIMLFEADRPLRRLTMDAVRLAKGDTERMSEDAHAGKFGSIARSMNIHIDKLGREAKSAKKDLDQLLGPAPEGSLGTIDLLATTLPAVRPGGPAPAVTPPPSEFRFQDSGPVAAPQPPGRSITPPPFPRVATSPAIVPAPPSPPPRSSPSMPVTPPARPSQPLPGAPPPRPSQPIPITPSPSRSSQQASLSFDDLALGRSSTELDPLKVDPYFKQIFDQFVSTKQSCNESIAGLVYEKFAEKLVRNREELIMKTGCREVRFTVYVKDGKAALKATPVKDEP